ncbi:MAG: ABC transporter permease [Pseudomonadota bacterium]
MSSASPVADVATAPTEGRRSLWSKALYKFTRDRLGMGALAVVLLYGVIAAGAAAGLWGQDWAALSDATWAAASADHWFGTNRIGQDIFARALYSTRTAFEVGFVVAIASTIVGALLGAAAGFFSGSWIDEIVLWLMGVLDSIPFYLFVAAIAYAMKGSPFGMHVAMVATFWTITGRLVRGEVIKLKGQEFVEAARAIGVPRLVIIGRHILPNTFHILLVQATIVFVAAIKSEVILSFLGLGVKDSVSWGLMIAEAANEVQNGHFNNFIWASVFLFGLVMAFNLFSDALQDALDPRQVA